MSFRLFGAVADKLNSVCRRTTCTNESRHVFRGSAFAEAEIGRPSSREADAIIDTLSAFVQWNDYTVCLRAQQRAICTVENTALCNICTSLPGGLARSHAVVPISQRLPSRLFPMRSAYLQTSPRSPH